MKKYIGWSIVAVIVSAIVMCGWIVYDSRDYFYDYFEYKRQKLNLRSEQSVDSLLTVINNNEQIIDSLKIVISTSEKMTDEKINLYKNQLNDNIQTITNLRNVIEHQNTIIDDLRK